VIGTLPNLLTMGRVAAAPLFGIVFLFGTGQAAHWIAFALFTAAALTDFLDGWLARRLDRISALGRMLDPIADKAMVVVALAALMHLSGYSAWIVLPALAILLREVLISGLREFLGAIKLPVTRLAKWKTTAQMLGVAGLLLAGATASGGLRLAAVLMLWLAALLTVVSGWDYFRQALPHLQERDGS